MAQQVRQPIRRRRGLEPAVLEEMGNLAEAGMNGKAMEAALAKKFPGAPRRYPSLRTLQDIAREYSQLAREPWRFGSLSMEEDRAVLRLVLLRAATSDHPVRPLSMAEGRQAARLLLTFEQDIPLSLVRLLTTESAQAEANNARFEGYETYLAFRPWATERTRAYVKSIMAGQITEPDWKLVVATVLHGGLPDDEAMDFLRSTGAIQSAAALVADDE